MKTNVGNLVLGIIIILSVSCSLVEAQNGPSTVFVHANVIPMNKEVVLSDYSVVVADGRITQLGLSSSIPIPEPSVRTK